LTGVNNRMGGKGCFLFHDLPRLEVESSTKKPEALGFLSLGKNRRQVLSRTRGGAQGPQKGEQQRRCGDEGPRRRIRNTRVERKPAPTEIPRGKRRKGKESNERNRSKGARTSLEMRQSRDWKEAVERNGANVRQTEVGLNRPVRGESALRRAHLTSDKAKPSS